ncbi:MAG: xanthine dehydrogenase family protein molybdopterin-binding subunit [Acidimicrobiales bacterium]|nr:xanthine dehydrogenase family protein molybdopterin-binding subunit [Acidimicrobiales bacterium]
MSILGNRVERVEDARLLVGQHCYTEDIALPDMLHAAFVRSYEAHAELRGIDTSRATASPGVVAVFTADDLGDDLPLVPTGGGFVPLPGLEQPSLARGRVRYVGEPIAVVLAESRYAAVDGASAIEIDYEQLAAVVDPIAALDPGSPVIWETWGTNQIGGLAMPRPDDLLKDADVVVDGAILNQRVASVSLEPRSVLAGWHPESGEFTVWSSTQQPHKLRDDIAAALHVEASEVRVIAPDVGGGFGAKANAYPEELLLPLLARRLGRPVRYTETRSENMIATTHGRAQHQHFTIGAKQDGTVVALSAELVGDVGAYPSMTPMLLMATGMMAQGTYRFPRVHVSSRGAMTNTTPTSAYRGAGRPEATYLIERALDHLALELDMDPAELRRRNLIPADAFPYATVTGVTYDSGNYPALLETLLAAMGYEELRAEQHRRRSSGASPLLGIGIACYVEITGGIGLSEDATVEVLDNGRVQVLTGTSPHGQGHATTWSQIVADELGVPMDHIKVIHGDTALVPTGGGTVGSRSAQFGGSAVQKASAQLADRLRDLAAHLFEAAPEDIELIAGAAAVRGTPAKAVTLQELAVAAADPTRRPADFEEGLRVETTFTQAGVTFPSGAHGAVVDVDPDTGKVDLLRLVAVDDCGNILNPLIVEGQIHGGLAQGVAQALFEEISFTAEGQPQATTLTDYLTPAASELPRFETHEVVTPSPLNPLGVKGVGESGSIGSTPAVVSAVCDALSHLGVRHIDPPLTPEKVWRAAHRPDATAS